MFGKLQMQFLVPTLRPSEVPSQVSVRYSIAEYRALYLSGQLTPLAVVNSILPLIRRDVSPPGIHSTPWIDLKVDLVLKAAEESTLRYKENRSLGALDGILVAIKDEYDVEGYLTTLGSANKPDQGPEGAKVNSWCIQKLKEAGVVIMRKANMVEYGMGMVSSSSLCMLADSSRHIRPQSYFRNTT